MGEEIDVDGLMADIEAPTPDRAMTGGDTAPTAAPAATAAPTDWRQGFDWSFDHNGQKVAVDSAEKAKTWLSLGHNYSQRAAELNRTQAQYAQRERELADKYKGYDRFSELDDYARKNPDWWNHVQKGWQERQTHGIDPSLAPVLQPVLQRLQQTESFLENLQQQQFQEKQAKEDQALEAEIGEIRKANPNIDLAAKDETGRSLEDRVIRHANEQGIRSFRAAFRDYLHDRLVEEAKISGRAAIARDTQAKAKAGVLGQTPAPVKGLQPAQNVRGKSYGQLAKEGLAEFGITS